MLPMQGAQVQSLIGELRSHLLHGAAQKTHQKQNLYACNACGDSYTTQLKKKRFRKGPLVEVRI